MEHVTHIVKFSVSELNESAFFNKIIWVNDKIQELSDPP